MQPWQITEISITIHYSCCHSSCCEPIPAPVIYVLGLLFLIGLGVSIFILVVVHNVVFFVCLLCFSALVAGFLIWNAVNYRRRGALLNYLHSLPDSDLSIARPGQLVKVTGPVSCGNVSLESSYEKVSRCVYTSTLLYEYGELGLKPADVKESCFLWRVAYSETVSTDFYITDRKSGIRALVKAGPDSRVIPLIIESDLVRTSRKCRVLSSHLRKWLRDRNLSTEARLLRLQEGYIKEGSHVSVIGLLSGNGDAVMIIQPQELTSTGCLWQKLLLPVDVDGLIFGLAETRDTFTVQTICSA